MHMSKKIIQNRQILLIQHDHYLHELSMEDYGLLFHSYQLPTKMKLTTHLQYFYYLNISYNNLLEAVVVVEEVVVAVVFLVVVVEEEVVVAVVFLVVVAAVAVVVAYILRVLYIFY